MQGEFLCKISAGPVLGALQTLQESLRTGLETLRTGLETLRTEQISLRAGQESLRAGQESLRTGLEAVELITVVLVSCNSVWDGPLSGITRKQNIIPYH